MPISVLVVEDDPVWCEALCGLYETILAPDEPEVITASRVPDARRLLKSRKFDLISVDLNLPAMHPEDGDGRTIIRYSSARQAASGLIVITGLSPFDRIQSLDGLQTLSVFMNRHFPGRNLYLPKNRDKTVEENVAVFRLGLQRRDLLALRETENVFRLEGQKWRVRFAGQTVFLDDGKSPRTLHFLLEHAGKSIHVLQILQETDPQGLDPRWLIYSGFSPEQLEQLGLSLSLWGGARADSDEMRQILMLQQQRASLDRNLEIAKEMDAWDRIAELEDEIEHIKQVLDRYRPSDPMKKPRDTLYQRIRRGGIKRIAGVHPSLSTHLDSAIETGEFCCYAPKKPVPWAL